MEAQDIVQDVAEPLGTVENVEEEFFRGKKIVMYQKGSIFLKIAIFFYRLANKDTNGPLEAKGI